MPSFLSQIVCLIFKHMEQEMDKNLKKNLNFRLRHWYSADSLIFFSLPPLVQCENAILYIVPKNFQGLYIVPKNFQGLYIVPKIF